MAVLIGIRKRHLIHFKNQVIVRVRYELTRLSESSVEDSCNVSAAKNWIEAAVAVHIPIMRICLDALYTRFILFVNKIGDECNTGSNTLVGGRGVLKRGLRMAGRGIKRLGRKYGPSLFRLWLGYGFSRWPRYLLISSANTGWSGSGTVNSGMRTECWTASLSTVRK